MLTMVMEELFMAKDILTMKFKVDPCQGFAAQAVAAVPEGYQFLKMERKGTKAVVYYRKIKKD
jgi:hypothetical protein